MDLPEDLTAAKPRYTAEQRASHEASLKAVAVCDQIQEMYKRARCFHDAPVDYTEEDPDEIEGVTLTGIDHLADYLSVQDFSVDGAVGGRAGQGGSIMCCANLPNRWREGLTVEVRWNVTNWRDCTGANYVRRVPVEPYHRPNPMYVHFLADGNVRVAPPARRQARAAASCAAPSCLTVGAKVSRWKCVGT
ncbi:DUF3304 domain-containing protein [Lysobacter sp. FW306-1B-D06B]|uniref:DUF3304 domain-containing protein n=1 Tax=Lysobacter sp. FW306-1B-D06B TaxID=3140250 RepID=UPI0031403C91